MDRNRYHTKKLPVIVLATVFALFLEGCDKTGRDSGELSADDDATGNVMSSTLSVSQAISDLEVTGIDKLMPGTFDIRLHEDKVTLLSNDAPLRGILNDLAILAGFELVDAGIRMERVTHAIAGSDVHSILVALLKSGPYQIIYEFDNTSGADSLTRVVVGHLTAGEETVPAPQPLPATDCASIKLEGAPLPDAGKEALSPEDQVYLSLLLDTSPEVRADAAESITATGIVLDYLSRVITTDPSPEVRMAAATSLGNSEDPRAMEILILGLNDADPEVLVEVIDSLDYLDDRSAIPYLQPLLNHPDEDVRDAAESAIESLQYN